METRAIPVSGSVRPALVSAEDYDLINVFRWHLDVRPDASGVLVPRRVRTNYRLPGQKPRMVSLHQLVMNFPGGLVDHVNRDVLDNRRENLRVADKSGNRANAKPNGDRRYKGTTAYRGRWVACLYTQGKRLNLGTYDTEELAAAA